MWYGVEAEGAKGWVRESELDIYEARSRPRKPPPPTGSPESRNRASSRKQSRELGAEVEGTGDEERQARLGRLSLGKTDSFDVVRRRAQACALGVEVRARGDKTRARGGRKLAPAATKLAPAATKLAVRA